MVQRIFTNLFKSCWTHLWNRLRKNPSSLTDHLPLRNSPANDPDTPRPLKPSAPPLRPGQLLNSIHCTLKVVAEYPPSGDVIKLFCRPNNTILPNTVHKSQRVIKCRPRPSFSYTRELPNLNGQRLTRELYSPVEHIKHCVLLETVIRIRLVGERN